MTFFHPDGPKRAEILPRILGMTDYRITPGEGLHPVVSENGRCGILCVLRAPRVTTPNLIAAFERMLALMEQTA
jgi:hypothetical protein